jgi:hypothetical protein
MNPTGLEYFRSLGQAISGAWSGCARRPADLPEVAAQALADVEVPDGLDAAAILSAFATASELPPQPGRRDDFGQPPLVVYRDGDLYIQALTWMDGTTAIHEHGFAGAFMVLQGASLHVVHDFSLGEQIAEDRLLVGDLRLRQPEVLRRLDVRRIEPGGQFIHALFHLERPTVTVVVRNDTSGLPHPQYTYLSPGLAWDGEWRDRTWVKRVQSIDALIKLDPTAGRHLVEDLVAKHDSVWEAFRLVHYWCQLHDWDEIAEELTARLAARAGALSEVLSPAMSQQVAVRKVLLRRGMLRSLHQRVLLALLANLPDSFLLDCVEELAGPGLRGISGLSFSTEKLQELRRYAIPGGERTILTEVRAAWGQPFDPAELMQ